MAKQNEKKTEPEENSNKELPVCGIIMPISFTDGYRPTHWAEILAIIENVVLEAGFKPNLVSKADDVGIIHNRIVTNLAENPIVICDVSSKNPNVMFELGLRLAFDKATIIIKDDLTSYNFDTSPIEHLGYPSDLRYSEVEEFKKTLTSKLKHTYKGSQEDPSYSTFLKNFVSYKRELATEEVSNQEYIDKKIDMVLQRLDMFESNRKTDQSNTLTTRRSSNLSTPVVKVRGSEISSEILSYIQKFFISEVRDLVISSVSGEFTYEFYLRPDTDPMRFSQRIGDMLMDLGCPPMAINYQRIAIN